MFVTDDCVSKRITDILLHKNYTMAFRKGGDEMLRRSAKPVIQVHN
jgi:hypothetical protein